jgi:GNAT superfamily N-acetyltransferase
MHLAVEIAIENDAVEVAALRNAVDNHLARRWANDPPNLVTEKGSLFAMRNASVYLVREECRIIATFTLTAKKPWAIDKSYFCPSKKPLYLLAMAVAPDRQRAGVGRQVLKLACKTARESGSDAIRLDAFDKESGAGEFYRKCGFTLK